MSMVSEITTELIGGIIPFWKSLRDDEYGGYYGYVDFNLVTDKEAVKGCILNSRILWFFSNAYMLLHDDSLLEEARHAFEFFYDKCLDNKNGGVYWSMTYDGQPYDTTKHTYNQAFAVYALSSYYDASKDIKALNMAYDLYRIIEDKCKDANGYMESFNLFFEKEDNDKLSENGVMAERTMNTLLHVFEAYSELYRVGRDDEVGEKLKWILDIFVDKIYNSNLKRQEVFFDNDYNSLIDLHSFGHDIETSWLLDRGVEILGDVNYSNKIHPVTFALAENILKTAFDGRSLSNESEKGVVDENRIWWVQAEAVVGFLNAYQRDNERIEFLEAAHSQWEFIRDYLVDSRKNGEWYYSVTDKGNHDSEKRPIVEPWKCPYHNGRMCIEVIKRGIN